MATLHGHIDEKLRAAHDAVLRRNPGETGVPPGRPRGPREPRRRSWPSTRSTPTRKLIERICEPERQIIFRVPWVDDRGEVQINRGFRVEFNSRARPVQGRPAVPPRRSTSGIVKFLGFEQIFKNALTGMPIGGGKGGSDFDPKGRSDAEVMRFCQSLHDRAVPPPRRVHRRARRRHRRRRPRDRLPVRPVQAHHQPLRVRRPHRQGPRLGRRAGAHARPPATAPCSSPSEMLRARGDSPSTASACVVSGSGNVAIYAIEKVAAARRHGRRLLRLRRATSSTTTGIDLDAAQARSRRSSAARIGDYAERRGGARASSPAAASGRSRATVALPCATQNELDAARRRDARRATAASPSAEGANMPTHARGGPRSSRRPASLFGPGKAANAGGVATSRAGDAAERQPRLLDLRAHRGSASPRSWPSIHDALPRRPPTSTARPATTCWAPTSPASSGSPTRCSPSA